jgi:hypothetical protein
MRKSYELRLSQSRRTERHLETNGVVDCVMLEAVEPSVLRFSWTDNGGGDAIEVVYRLEPRRRIRA